MTVEADAGEAFTGKTRTDTAFERLAELIVEGDIAPGSVVNEAEWAERLEMSRGPVREAVRRLQGRRLVTREPYLKARVVMLSTQNLIDIFELREALEGMACRLATQRMSDAAIKEIFDHLDPGAAPSPVRFDFHVAIAHGSGNARIIEALCDDLYYLLRLYRRHSGAALGRSKEASREHWQIAKAMMARDADLAESLMRSHIGRATTNLTAQIAAAGGDNA
ncbi:GntR family transcriptional regulator [Pelagibacterium sp.]|uniref:GntR family transcriptional regulator n=1 Tax=Pelagibacterium sp. TaxID=1967288 RepID=UPI003BAB3111